VALPGLTGRAKAHGVALPFTRYDRLPEIDQCAIVEKKRLGLVLEVAQAVQAKRDNRHSQSVPRSDGEPPRRRGQVPGFRHSLPNDGG
jgi:hypothetical protein